MNFNEECSIMKQMTKTEEAIKTCYQRVGELEKKLNEERLPDDKRNTLSNELKEVRKLLDTNEKQLKCLHKHNRKSFVFAASLFFLCFLFYMLYILVVGL